MVRDTSDPWDGAHLKAWRTRRMLTQQQLAERIGVDWRTIWRWETGRSRPRMPQRQALCTALDVTPEQMYGVG